MLEIFRWWSLFHFQKGIPQALLECVMRRYSWVYRRSIFRWCKRCKMNRMEIQWHRLTRRWNLAEFHVKFDGHLTVDLFKVRRDWWRLSMCFRHYFSELLRRPKTCFKLKIKILPIECNLKTFNLLYSIVKFHFIDQVPLKQTRTKLWKGKLNS